jgi:FkbM family methyltransferase
MLWSTTDHKCFCTYVASCLLTTPTIFREKSLRSVDVKMAGRKWVFGLYGTCISLDGALFGGVREIYCRRVYFSLPDFRLKPSDTVIDLGANAGVFAILAGCICKKVVALEAQSGFVPEIYSNALSNSCSERVSVEFGIVGANSGVFCDVGHLEAASHFVEKPPLISMDDLIIRHSIKLVNFLKIDIEGSEFDLFNGDISWLMSVEKIAMEVHLEFGDIVGLVTKLKDKGFDVWLVDNDQHIVDEIEGSSGYIFAKRKDCVGA